MERESHITITITGITSDGPLNPKDIDISEIKELLTDFESLLFPSRAEKEDRPKVSYEIQEGSVKNLFFLPIAKTIMFSALMEEVGKQGNIDFLEKKSAAVIDKWQKKAFTTGRQYKISSSLSDKSLVTINKESNFIATQSDWVSTSLYLYGKIYEEGGRKEVNLHILTDRYGTLTVDATEEQLTSGENKLFKVYGLWVKGKQNIQTGELKDLKLVDFLAHQPDYNELVLRNLIKKSSSNWSKIKNKDKWLQELRGGENAKA